jgi:pentatricopeptide repeat protein
MRAAVEQPAEEEPQPRPEEQTQVRQEQPQPQMQAQAQAAAQSPLQAQEQATEFEMPRPGDILVSGPLPSLTGYEDLVELMEKNPQDTGSYMAMATAYVNAGEMESALRVYRRLIKRPGVSAMLLGMIDEELDDLRASAGNLPRYHQVRGDLYLKLGRHREAIEEYNKLV